MNTISHNINSREHTLRFFCSLLGFYTILRLKFQFLIHFNFHFIPCIVFLSLLLVSDIPLSIISSLKWSWDSSSYFEIITINWQNRLVQQLKMAKLPASSRGNLNRQASLPTKHTNILGQVSLNIAMIILIILIGNSTFVPWGLLWFVAIYIHAIPAVHVSMSIHVF